MLLRVANRLQVVVRLLIRQGLGSGGVHLLLVLLEESLVDLGGGRSQGGGGDELLLRRVSIRHSAGPCHAVGVRRD